MATGNRAGNGSPDDSRVCSGDFEGELANALPIFFGKHFKRPAPFVKDI